VSEDTTPGPREPGGGESVEQKGSLALTLHVPTLTDGSVNPSTTLEWGIPEALKQAILYRRYKQPMVVVAVRVSAQPLYQGRSARWVQWRLHLVPLEDGGCHIVFPRPGEVEVRAVVVDMPDSGRDLNDLQTSRTVFAEHPDAGTNRYGLTLGSYIAQIGESQSSVECTVDEAHFAPEPAPWKQKLVGLFEGTVFRSPLKDECHNRWRWLLSAFLAFLALTLGMLVRTLVLAVSLLAGRRNTQWSGMRPFNFKYGPWGMGRSVYYTDQHGNARVGFPAALMVLNPAVVLVTWVSMFLSLRTTQYRGGPQSIVNTVIVLGALTLALWFGLFIARVRDNLKARRKVAQAMGLSGRRVTSAKQPQSSPSSSLLKRLERVTVRGDGSLPPARRTWRWLYWWAKDRVCKPFPERLPANRRR